MERGQCERPTRDRSRCPGRVYFVGVVGRRWRLRVLTRVRWLGFFAGNVAGAAFAMYLLLPNLRFFLQTGRPIGLVFVIQQVWVAVVFVTSRPPRTVSRRALDWIAAYAGWFTSFLVRPGGYHLAWGLAVGFWVQVLGLLLWAWAFLKLARS